jgi:hypothetical protein
MNMQIIIVTVKLSRIFKSTKSEVILLWKRGNRLFETGFESFFGFYLSNVTSLFDIVELLNH